MLYSKLAHRAKAGFPDDVDIDVKAFEYIYEAERLFARDTDTYQIFIDNLMVSAASSHVINLPSGFKSLSGKPEWNGHPLTPLAQSRSQALMNSAGNWITGEPYYFWLINKQMYLYPEPTILTDQFSMIYNAIPADSKLAVAEVSTIFVRGSVSGGEYFKLKVGSTGYAIYLIYDGTGADPAVTGYAGTSVTITSSNTDAEIATAIAAVINGLSNVSSAASGATVTVTQTNTGNMTDVADVDTPYLFHVTTQGQAAQTSPGTDVNYHDLLVIYARAQIHRDLGDRNEYLQDMAEWNKALILAKHYIRMAGQTNPSRISDTAGGAPKSAFGGGQFAQSNQYIMNLTETVSIRRATQAFTNVSSVTVTHNWGVYPIVQVVDNSSPPNQISGAVTYPTANSFTVNFGDGNLKTGIIIYQ